MQAVCIYLNKSLQTLLCNTHVFALPLYICVELSFLKLKLKLKRRKTFPKYCIKMSVTFSGMWKNFNGNLMQL